ncbi:BQ2448_3997 [Microbotryum intermedium]|uniref:BQ2448_3997 protein n=1 Tax=Microbotryum intermedium TaxID=269621 RepID=A0A238FF71_9BASI|nr:BQ2448_3997 [Microbotryum intermedium]
MPSLHALTTLTLSLSLLLNAPLIFGSPSSSDFIDPRIINRDLGTYGSTSSTRSRSIRKTARRNLAHRLSRRDTQGPKRLNRATEATLKCLTAYSFALCDGDRCTDMGAVAAGTKCVDNAITWDDATGAATTAAAEATTSSEPTPTVTPVNLAVKKTTAAAAATSTAGSSSDDEDDGDDEDCDPDDSEDDDETSTTGAATQAATTAAASATQVKAVNLNAVTGSYITGGKGTFFYQYGAYGACGKIHADSDPIVALALARYGTGSNNAPDCGRKVQVVNAANGKSVIATVADACPGCANYNSLDLSTGAFDQIAEQATGVIE